MKIRLLFFILFAITLRLQAQDNELKIKGFNIAPNDLTASTKMRLDALGDPCALLKVQIPGQCKFEGSDIVAIVKDIGEYHIYMAKGAKNITVKTEECPALEVWFSDFDEEMDRLESKCTYILTLHRPSAAARQVVDLDIKVLKNGTLDRYESTNFKYGESLYLKFMSPIDGYVAIYLQNGNTMERLLPYPQSTTPSVMVKGEEDYVFFSRTDNKAGLDEVEEYVLGTNQPEGEVDDLCVIFSPNAFKTGKARKQSSTDFAGDFTKFPPVMDMNAYIQWLNKWLEEDNSLQVVKIPITIKP